MSDEDATERGGLSEEEWSEIYDALHGLTRFFPVVEVYSNDDGILAMHFAASSELMDAGYGDVGCYRRSFEGREKGDH